MATYDTVIRNGQVADGTGKKLFTADVALKGDRIAAVEPPGTLHGVRSQALQVHQDQAAALSVRSRHAARP